MVNLFLLLSLLQEVLSIKVLQFESSSDGRISYDILTESTPLPPLFTLCSTFRESHIYAGNGFFIIYGSSGDPWMTLSNWASDHQIVMWLKINTFWVKVRDIPTHWMNSWINVCIETDTTTGNISVLVNENPPLSFDVPELTIKTPNNLKESLYIGLFDVNFGRRQFQGEVANFNIFSGKHLIKRNCDDHGDIVNKTLSGSVLVL